MLTTQFRMDSSVVERWYWTNGTQVCIACHLFRSFHPSLAYFSAIDSGIKLRPSEEELKVIGPEFTEHWQRVFANALDKPVLWMGSVCMYVHKAPTGAY